MKNTFNLPFLTGILFLALSARGAIQEGTWERFAVVISCQSGLSGDKTLKYAHTDAARVAQLLKTIGRVTEQNILVIRAANGPELRTQLKSLGKRITAARKKNRRIFLQCYYSGHGAFSYFHVGGDRIAFSDIRKMMAAKQADARLFVLDVCYGASFFASKGFDAVAPVPVEIKVEDETQGEVVITSSSFDEKSYEVKPLQGSIFTSHWLMALRGAGDKDQDGRVSLFEAYNYAYHKTVAYTAENLNRSQHPTYNIQLQGGRYLVLTHPRAAESGIVFRNCPAGDYSITDQSRRLSIGDVYLPGGDAFSLALEPGNYEVRHSNAKDGALTAEIGLKGHTLTQLDYRDFSLQSPGKGTSKGDGVSIPAGPAPGSSSPWKRRWSARINLAGEYFRDSQILDDLNRPTELDGLYGSTPSFEIDYHDPAILLECYFHIGKSLGLGSRVTLQTRHYYSHAKGAEPSIGELPVHVTIEKQFGYQRVGWGPSLQWYFLQRRKLALGLEATPQYVKDYLTTSWELSRPLYDEHSYNQSDMEGRGYRLQADLVLDWMFNRGLSRWAWTGHFKTGGFYQSLDMYVASNHASQLRTIHSREYGLQCALGFSFGDRK